MRNSVAGKVALGAMLLVLATVSATGYAAIRQQTEAMERAEQTTADLLATAVVVTCAADIFTGDMANLGHTVRRMREHNPALLAIVIRGTDDGVLAAHPPDPASAPPGLTVTRPISLYGQNYGRLDLVFSTENRDRARADILNTTISVTAVLLIVSFLGALGWAYYFAGPIVSLAKAAERVAGGDLKVRVDVRRSDEIGMLAERFNEMVENLRKSRADLERTLNELSTLYSVSRIINTTSSRDEILRLNLETLATGFGFSRVVILLEMEHAWRVAALRADDVVGGASPDTLDLDRLGLSAVTRSEEPVLIPSSGFPRSWGFPVHERAYAVPLRSGSVLVGLLVAAGPGAESGDAAQVLGVVASQIAPPVLISIMSDRERLKLTQPLSQVFSRVEGSLARTSGFGLGLALLSFRLSPTRWAAGAGAAERAMEDLLEAIARAFPECELVARTSVNRALVVMPGCSLAEARKALMTADLPGFEDLETSVVAAPEQGTSAAELLAAVERS